MRLFNNRHGTDKSEEQDVDDDIEEFNSLFDIGALDNLDAGDSNGGISGESNKANETVDPSVHTLKTNTTEVITSDESFERISAIESFSQRSKIELKLAVVWNNKGVNLSRLGKYTEAIEAYDQALLLDPDYFSAWNNKGVALSKLGKFTEAIEAYDQALRINQNYPALYETPMISNSGLSTQT